MAVNTYWRDVLTWEPDPQGGYRQESPDGAFGRMSDEGFDDLVLMGRITERWSEHLAVLQEQAIGGICHEHGRDISHFEWWINDYVCEPAHDPDHVEFMLCGWHEALEFCIAARVNTQPAGLLLWSYD